DCSERDCLGLEYGLLIGPSMSQTKRRLPDPGRIRLRPVVCVASYAAQNVAPRYFRRFTRAYFFTSPKELNGANITQFTFGVPSLCSFR
ncbi:MAG: hypothetical protein M3Z32_09600, partial [Acidobacteriota bacterium]|nr:hypothetical protein [Acidobacteriota bacterium]